MIKMFITVLAVVILVVTGTAFAKYLDNGNSMSTLEKRQKQMEELKKKYTDTDPTKPNYTQMATPIDEDIHDEKASSEATKNRDGNTDSIKPNEKASSEAIKN